MRTLIASASTPVSDESKSEPGCGQQSSRTRLSVQLPEHRVDTVVEQVWLHVSTASDQALDDTPELLSRKAVWVIWT